MLGSRFSSTDVPRARRWFLWGLVIFTLSCSLGSFISFIVSDALDNPIRVSGLLSSTDVHLIEGGIVALVGGTISGLISAFLVGLLFQSELAARQRQWYVAVVAGTLVSYLVMVAGIEVFVGPSASAAGFILAIVVMPFVGGGITGFAQWLVLRQTLRGAGIWVAIVAACWTIPPLIFVLCIRLFPALLLGFVD